MILTHIVLFDFLTGASEVAALDADLYVSILGAQGNATELRGIEGMAASLLGVQANAPELTGDV